MLYMNYLLPLFDEIEDFNEENLSKIFREIELKNGNPIFWFSSERKFAPLNIYDYSLHLNDKHAID